MPTTTSVAPTTTTTIPHHLHGLCAALEKVIDRTTDVVLRQILILIFNALGCKGSTP